MPTAMLGALVTLILAVVAGTWKISALIAALLQRVDALEKSVSRLPGQITELREMMVRLDERTPCSRAKDKEQDKEQCYG